MLFSLLAPRFQLYYVYALWFTCSQILAILCLCSLVYLLPDISYILFILFGLLAPYFSYILFMLFGLLAPRFWLYSDYALWFTCSHIFSIFCLCSLLYLLQILVIFCLCSLVYLLQDISHILFMLFRLLAPRFQLYSVYALWFTCSRFWLYSVYALWFTCSQILAIFCLCSLVYLLPDFSYIMFMLFGLLSPDVGYILFMLFGLLAPRFLLYSVYALWFTCSQILAIFCLYSLAYLLQILAIFCLCFLVYLLPDISHILFMLFLLLAPRFQLYYDYALWFTCSKILAIFCLCYLVYLPPDLAILC